MSRKKRTDQSVNLTIGGDVVDGQIAIGSNIEMTKSVKAKKTEALPMLMEALKAQVKKDAPPELQEKALEKVSALAASMTSPKADRSEIETIQAWLIEHIPTLKSLLEIVTITKT